MANTLDVNVIAVQDGYEFLYGTVARVLMGQYFKAGASGPISRASASLFKLNSPTDNLIAKIYSATLSVTTLFVADATPIATSTTSYDGSSLPSYPAPVSLANAPFVDFDFNGSASFVSGSYYFLSIERTGAANDTNRYGWSGNGTSVYSDGGQIAGTTATAWVAGNGNGSNSNTANNDQTFRTYYDPSLGNRAFFGMVT